MSPYAAGTDRRSVLLVHHRAIASPYSATVPHYLARELVEDHDVRVLSQRSNGDGRDQFPDAVVHHEVEVGSAPILSSLLFVLVSALYAVALGARHRFDAVYGFQQTLVQGWAGAVAGSSRFVVGLQSVPVRQRRDITTSRVGLSPLARARVALQSQYATAVETVLGRADEVVCLTDGIRDKTEQEFGIDLADAHVIGMGVDADRFAADGDGVAESTIGPAVDRRATAEAAGGSDDTLVITYVGSIGPPRGLEHTLDALARTDDAVELRVAGGGDDDYMASLRDRAAELGVADRVTWLGIVPHDEVPAVLASADVAVSPLCDIESYRISFPAKLLEYMAAGTLVVATDIPAHRRLVDHGANGLLYDGTASGLADALTACRESEVDCDALGDAARSTAESYDWGAVACEHERVLLGRPVRRRRRLPASA